MSNPSNERQPLLQGSAAASPGPGGRDPLVDPSHSYLSATNNRDLAQRQRAIRKCWQLGIVAIGLGAIAYLAMGVFHWISDRRTHEAMKRLKGSCSDILPIQLEEFQERRQNLSSILTNLNAEAYVTEPGANMKYFTDIDWSLSERPFLLVIQSRTDKSGLVLTKSTIVSPAFEASRARQMIAPESGIDIQTWPEEGSAYETVQQVLDSSWSNLHEFDKDKQELTLHDSGKKKPSVPQQVYLDKDMRHFLVHGLSTQLTSADRQVSFAHPTITNLRIKKSAHEIEILRCAARTTVAVLGAVRDILTTGMKESEAEHLVTLAFNMAGLDYESGSGLVTFGKDSALPHGSGNDSRLLPGMFVLFDVGARLHGYTSDITRTFWIEQGKNKEMNDELDKVWEIVKQAQNASLNAIHPGASCSSIDKAARKLIDKAGYGARFTHRLGHGIGLQGHEPPYLNGGNHDQSLEPGMVFTVEPGIYVEGSFGVRLEDMVLVTENGYDLLSGQLAENAWEV